MAKELLAEERQQRLMARAGEELAMVDLRRAREEARYREEEQLTLERKQANELAEQRKELDTNLRKAEGEHAAAVAALHKERQQMGDLLRQQHTEHTRELEKQMLLAQEERQLLVQQTQIQRELEAKELAKAAELAKSKLAQSDEQRIEHLQAVSVRRLRKRDLSRGWMTWHASYAEYARKRRLLQAVANRLARPRLSAAYALWRAGWKEHAVMGHEQRLAEEEEARRVVEAQLERAMRDLAEARRALAEATARERGHDGALAQRIEAEKERSVAHLQQLGVRRLLKQGLARGWSAWLDVHKKHVRKRQLLAKVGSRLLRPKLSASYSHWERSWRQYEAALAAMTLEERVKAHKAEWRDIEEGLRRELETARREVAEWQQAFERRVGTEDNLKRQMEEALEAEKEKRVEHLQQMGLKRLMNAGLARGWAAWHGVYADRKRKRTMLRQVGARLLRPKLAACYSHWRRGWEIDMATTMRMTQEERLAAEVANSKALHVELSQLRKELGEARNAMLAGRGQEAELKRQMEEALEAEKEKRVEHLQQMGLKRLMNAGLARGWAAWHGVYADRKRKRTMLRQVGARLLRPKLAACYSHWRRGWEIDMATTMRMTQEERLAAEVANSKALHVELSQLRKELGEACNAMLAGRGQEAELKRQMEEALEAEKEKRVEHLQQMGLKRLMNAGLARGWAAWHGVYADRKRKRTMLRQVGARLLRPKLAACYSHWRRGWEIDMATTMRMTQEERLAAEVANSKALHVELSQLRKELGEARNAMLAGRGQEAELKRQMEEALEAEKEKRVEHLQQMGLKRLMNAGLARGWAAWHGVYADRKRKRTMLRQVGARLLRPKLAACYSHWRRGWEIDMATTMRMTQEERLAAEVANSKALHVELSQLRKELGEARNAMLAGRGQEAELKRQMEEALEAEKEKRVEHLQQMGLKRLMNAGLARGWTAWHGVYADRKRKRTMLRQVGARLLRPKLAAAYIHWRRDWDAAVVMRATGDAKLAAMTNEQRLAVEMRRSEALEKENAELALQIAEARQAMAEGRGQEAERQRQMEEALEAEKEKRVEHLKYLAIRRIALRDLARGWMGWHEVWQDALRKRQLLQQAGSRLARPGLVAAYKHWRSVVLTEQLRKATMGHEQRLQAALSSEEAAGAENRQLRMQEQELRRELAEARQAMAEGRGQEEGRQRLLEQAHEAEKEKRVEHLQQLGVRRLLKQSLARGWSAWLDVHRGRINQLRLLRQASNMLMKPKLSMSYAHWWRDWRKQVARQAKAVRAQQAADSQDLNNTRELQLRGQIKKLSEELGEARNAMLAGRGQEAELKRQMEEALEAEKEKRVEHLQQMGLRRLMNAGLARGWSAWRDRWERRNRTRQVLRRAAARLMRPKLAAAYSLWWRDWDLVAAEVRRKAAMSEAEKKADEARELRAAMVEESARRKAVEETLELQRDYAQEQIDAARAELFDARKAATDARREAAAERARAEAVGKAREQVAELEAQRFEEVERRVQVQAELARMRSQADEEIALQRVALVEARKAATDALNRAAAEKAQGEAARSSYEQVASELKSARAAEVAATEAAIHAQNLLNEHQHATEEKLHDLLEQHRAHLMTEVMRTAEGYEQQLTELRLQIKVRDKPDPPPPLQIWSPPPPSSLLKLDGSSSKSIAQMINEQLREHGVRTIDLFRELDLDQDGYLSKAEWSGGITRMGPSLKMEAIDAAFLDADIDESKLVEFSEFEQFLKGRVRPPPPVRPRSPSPPPVAPTPKSKPAKKPQLPAEAKKNSPHRKQANLLAALASSMGVRPNIQWFDEAKNASVVGPGEAEFGAMMQERASGFGHADLDKDGKLDFDEFCSMVKFRETHNYTEKQLRAKFADLDEDGSGKVDLHEFISFSLRDALKRSRGRAIDLFQIWDEDKSGYIDQNEFGKAIVALGFVAGREDIKKVFQTLDEDGSGEIEYKELATMLRRGNGSSTDVDRLGPAAAKTVRRGPDSAPKR